MSIKIFQIGEDFNSDDGIEEWKMNNASQPYIFMKFQLKKSMDKSFFDLVVKMFLFMITTIP
jgi:hypothetical protein